jgi:hypothetical protein
MEILRNLAARRFLNHFGSLLTARQILAAYGQECDFHLVLLIIFNQRQ